MTIEVSRAGIDYTAIGPEIVVAVTAVVVLGLELVVPPERRRWLASVSILGLLAAGAACAPLWGQNRSAFAGTVAGDSYAVFFNVILIGTSFATAEQAGNVLLLVGIGFVAVGLAFKASAAPFHMWTPDVYEGAPTLVTTFMSVATKAAAFAAIGRVFVAALPGVKADWYVPLVFIAVVSLLIGNVVAITQDNIKRLLAYSGIAQAGYILLGILPGTGEGLDATLFYVAAYAVTNFGAFAVVSALGTRGERTEDIHYWSGLFYRRPFLATTMTLFMLSLAGIPPTVGFFAKLFVFRELVVIQAWPALAVAILTTVVSFYYYLRVVVVMLTAPAETIEPERVAPSMRVVLGVTAVLTVLLGILPTWIFDWSTRAATIHL